MVSLVAQPAMPLAIFLHRQALKFVSSCQALCWALSQSASSVGCSSSEDVLLESLGGMPSMGLGWCHFCHTDWIFSLGSDSESESSMHTKDMANASEGVFDLRVSLPLFAIRCHLAITGNLNFTLAGLGILIFTGDFLLVSWLPSVTWDWAEPDRRLQNEVILQAWLHD